MKKNLIVLFGLIALFGLTFAHNPRLVFKSTESLINVENPEISQAFYGDLSGKSDVYQIVSDTGFKLYLQLVVPMIDSARRDFVININDKNGNSRVLDGKTTEWTGFYEEFGGDWYWQGPELEKTVSANTYTISVSSPGFTGKYSLAIGKIESFPPKEIINAIIDLPILKTQFFGKSIFLSYWNYSGIFVLGMLIVIILVIYGIRKIVIFIRK